MRSYQSALCPQPRGVPGVENQASISGENPLLENPKTEKTLLDSLIAHTNPLFGGFTMSHTQKSLCIKDQGRGRCPKLRACGVGRDRTYIKYLDKVVVSWVRLCIPGSRHRERPSFMGKASERILEGSGLLLIQAVGRGEEVCLSRGGGEFEVSMGDDDGVLIEFFRA